MPIVERTLCAPQQFSLPSVFIWSIFNGLLPEFGVFSASFDFAVLFSFSFSLHGPGNVRTDVQQLGENSRVPDNERTGIQRLGENSRVQNEPSCAQVGNYVGHSLEKCRDVESRWLILSDSNAVAEENIKGIVQPICVPMTSTHSSPNSFGLRQF